MVILHVQVRVKPEWVEAFRQATMANARGSLREPGVARFDVLQHEDDPTRFLLVEAYRTPEAISAHKETPHYRVWNEAVASMLAEPRARARYVNVHPDDSGW